MRIVVVAPPWFEVPPARYGGVEAICYELVQDLSGRGHDVHLIGVGEGHVDARFWSTGLAPSGGLGTDRMLLVELAHAARAARLIREIRPDVVHDHSVAGPLVAIERDEPTVATVHNSVEDDALRFYGALRRRLAIVALSERQRQLSPSIGWTDVVHNGIRVDRYPFRADKDEYLLFLGRMSPDKGLDLAIDAARAVGLPLLIAAKCTEPGERVYFQERIRPSLTAGIRWLGEVSEAEKLRLLVGARGLLLPVRWEEPFGLVMLEAMACGTPVVALRKGAIPEVVSDGVTGFVRDHPAELPGAIRRLGSLDPHACRASVARCFDARSMVDRYELIYARVTRTYTVSRMEPAPDVSARQLAATSES